jgi:acetylornithine aminotransferase
MGSSLVTEVRGRGLLLGIGVVEGAAQPIADAALERGLIVNAINSTSIRIAPPLIVGDAEIAEFADRFGAALAAC